MELGALSISLSVKSLEDSQAFYSKLGFETVGGNASEKWLILRNRDHVMGLFQGMFEKNMLTFNPGWDQQGNETDAFTDVREIQKELKAHGVSLASEADESTHGPASLMLIDPDGNPILIDQHR
ncbi:MAG: VOC family protein [Desulfobulbaceae bacterium]|nr:MAG: VOC family protein [Desulfobulbaceae bacterium]